MDQVPIITIGTVYKLEINLVRLNEPDQPDPTQPEFEPWRPNLTRLNPNLDSGAQPDPKSGLIWVHFVLLSHYI